VPVLLRLRVVLLLLDAEEANEALHTLTTCVEALFYFEGDYRQFWGYVIFFCFHKCLF